MPNLILDSERLRFRPEFKRLGEGAQRFRGLSLSFGSISRHSIWVILSSSSDNCIRLQLWARESRGNGSMAIIVVGGSNRGVGKTALVCGLIRAFRQYRWAAVKITSHLHTQSCLPDAPKLAGDLNSSLPERGRPGSLRQVFVERINEPIRSGDPARSSTPAPSPELIWEESVAGEGTDTKRYLAAGAARALLVTAVEGDLTSALNQLWPRFGRGSNLIFESNSVAHHLSADACLLIHAVAERALPLPERKPSFLAALRYADALVAHAGADKVIPDGLCLARPDQEPEQRFPRPIFHLRALDEISPEMMAWLRRRLPSPQHF